MKKIFTLFVGLFTAAALSADVIVDLSQGQSIAETGATSVVAFADNVCSATITAPGDYVAGGVEFELEEPIAASAIEAVTGSILCDETGEYMELAIFVRDQNGHRWWSGTALSPYQLSEWTSLNETPSKSYWDGQEASSYSSQTIASVAANLSTENAITNYKVSVKDLKIKTKSTQIPTISAERVSKKIMVNGQMVIVREGEQYNVLGTRF